LASKPPGHDQNEGDHQAIGEAVTARGVGGNGGILNSRVLSRIN
jgi:hypothetical protein